jgi:hypothetical protein
LATVSCYGQERLIFELPPSLELNKSFDLNNHHGQVISILWKEDHAHFSFSKNEVEHFWLSQGNAHFQIEHLAHAHIPIDTINAEDHSNPPIDIFFHLTHLRQDFWKQMTWGHRLILMISLFFLAVLIKKKIPNKFSFLSYASLFLLCVLVLKILPPLQKTVFLHLNHHTFKLSNRKSSQLSMLKSKYSNHHSPQQIYWKTTRNDSLAPYQNLISVSPKIKHFFFKNSFLKKTIFSSVPNMELNGEFVHIGTWELVYSVRIP